MAAADFFLKIDGIQGESEDKTHTNEIQILSFSWGVSNAGSGSFGSGSGSGKASVSDISVQKYVDKSTPNLWKYCFLGKTVGDAVITVRKAGGDAPVEYLVYKLTEVFVSSVQDSGSEGGGIAMESVSLNFAKIEITYTLQSADGTAGASTPVTLDVKKNEVT
jgi:type VI secretion system secreted protein Hcp